jgi:hypothetical protein
LQLAGPDRNRIRTSVPRVQAHVAIEPDTSLITDCAFTRASGADTHDAVVGLGLVAGEPTAVEVLADSVYGTGQARAGSSRPDTRG